MYEEPYRWIEAVGNRRQYLDEQFRQGSPVVALSYADGILMLTVSRGTPKLYEIYDRIGLGGMGHPADLEKLRFSLLEMAHVEGFNRSPSDVTAARLMKYGLAPVIKQAFEEIYKAPFIVKILLADLSPRPALNGSPQDAFLTVDYDGSFEEATGVAVLAATPAIRHQMVQVLKDSSGLTSASLAQAFAVALRTWAAGSLAQTSDVSAQEPGVLDDSPQAASLPAPDDAAMWAHLRDALKNRAIECVVLERGIPGPSKFRALTASEVAGLLPQPLT